MTSLNVAVARCMLHMAS